MTNDEIFRGIVFIIATIGAAVSFGFWQSSIDAGAWMAIVFFFWVGPNLFK